MVDAKDMAETAPRGDAEAPPLRDADGAIRPEYVETVSKAIAGRDAGLLRALVGELHESDAGDLIEALDPDLRPELIELMGADFDFTALTEVDDAVREEILEELEPETVAEGVRELDSDDAVYILEDLPKDEQAEILGQLPAPERVALTKRLDYPEDSAGRRMQTEFIAVPPPWTVGQTIDYMRETEDLPERFFEIYVVGPDGKFLGAVPLDRLMRSKRPVPMSELMEPERYVVRATDDQEAVARQFERYNLVAAPVIDPLDRMVGVITFDDIVDVIEQEAEEDIKALGGVQAQEELSDTVWTIAKSRFNWLLVNLATAFLASSVLGLFEGELQKMVALAVLAPIVASQGGNAATQTMTVAVRALATRDLSDANAWRVIQRELTVGLLNGLAFAVITGVVAYAWFQVPGLGVVIGLAMVCNLIAAAMAGILIPLAIERFKFDPAVASGVFVTTVTDVVGFFSFLGIATLWFGLK
ncbi:MAG: magnesium transporter [Hyphomicrobiales bacterium]|jgi:magnesium transporter|nr:magnesium transporter [Hyphomicrobiales bacterium]